MKKKILGLLEGFAKAMVQPLMYLSCAGVLMVIGVLITNPVISKALPFLQWEPIQLVGKLIYDGVMVIISNLSVVFVIGIPAALAQKDKHRAALIGFMSYLVYLTTSNFLLVTSGTLASESGFLGLIGTGQAKILGIQCVDMGVFGGIILGCITGFVFNRTFKKRFKGALQIYSGANFSFLWMFFISMIFGAVSNLVWPAVQNGISALAQVIKDSGEFGLFLYGFLDRLLLPTGLHHLVYTPFQFSDLGGVIQVGEKTIAGAYAIVMTEAQMPVERFSDSIYYMATGFTKMFGYIGICGSFIYTAYPENRKRVTATLVPLAVTACLGAITEPIDFMFVFAAPALYLLHSCIAGLFIALLKVFDVTAFCGGNLIASLLMNISAGASKTRWPVMLILGIVEALLYFVLFSFLIKKFKFHTPGREGSVSKDGKPEEKAAALAASEVTMHIINGLGGKDNIRSVESCITRLRVNLADPSLLNEDLLNKTDCKGIVKKGNDVQIIYGLQVADIRRDVETQLEQI